MGFFLENEIGIAEENKTNGAMKREIKYWYLRASAIIVWKREIINEY